MGKFIDNPNERSLVNNYVDAYLESTNRYSKFIDSAPSFVTYYSRNYKRSTENEGLGHTTQIVGEMSGNRYDKVKNFPLYQVEVITPDMMNDGISGVSTEADTVATILPDTIKPVTDDLIAFSYHETDNDHNFRLYRIVDVDISTIDSNAYYRVSLQAVPYDIEELERQVIEDYQLIYDNIGTSEKVVLLETDYIAAGKIERILRTLSSSYVKNFFDKRIGCFLYKDEAPRTYIYSSDVHKFLTTHRSLLVSSKTFMKNVMVSEYVETDQYYGLHYKYIEDKHEYGQDPTDGDHGLFNYIFYDVRNNRNNVFNMFPEKFLVCQGHQIDGEVELLSYLNVVDLFDPVITVPSFIDIKSEAEELLTSIAAERGISFDEAKQSVYYSGVDNKTIFNTQLLERISGLYTLNEIPAGDWSIDTLPLSNQLVALINVIIGNDDIDVAGVMDIVSSKLKTLCSRSMVNYLYIPILLYILSKFLHKLVNK